MMIKNIRWENIYYALELSEMNTIFLPKNSEARNLPWDTKT